MHIVIAIPVLIALTVGFQGTDEAEFSREFKRIDEQNVLKVGRDARVEEYKRLLEKHPTSPQRAEAMIAIAHLLENSDPPKDVAQRLPEALRWFHRAAKVGPTGTDTWRKAQFLYAARIMYTDPIISRAILEEVARKSEGKSAVLAHVENDLVYLCIHERKLDEAEVRVEKLTNWYRDPKHAPKDSDEKSSIDGQMRHAASALLHCWASAPWPKQIRRERIKGFLGKHGGGGFQRVGESALKYLDAVSPSEQGGKQT